MIDYTSSLNTAQYAAATAADGATLVIAGAGSGKTRTIVYRLAWLFEQGVLPSQMLLLTFTRKAAQEMLSRASQLLQHGLMGVQGGTFHSFAYSVLRRYRPTWLEGRNFSVMDGADITAAIAHCKDGLGVSKKDRSFPKSQNIVGILSKARNKEVCIEEVLRREATHLLPHTDALIQIHKTYQAHKQNHALFDYDDLLFELEGLLQENRPEIQYLRDNYPHIMVDEYQDTNLVQARIVRLLGAKEHGGSGNVMAVGDDAQSIYAFRGANVHNILDFPKHFPGTSIVRLEENYRSTQNILNVANNLLRFAANSYDKKLFTTREGGQAVQYIQPASDKSQADMLVNRIAQLLNDYLPHEIAVLFRAGFHSYNLEAALQRAGILFRKYGGLRFSEAAHIKDVLAYARLIINPLDFSAFERIASLHKGIGKKTVQKLYAVAMRGETAATEKAFGKFPEFLADNHFLEHIRTQNFLPSACMEAIINHYKPRLEHQYPDDWPRRLQGLEEIQRMAATYQDLDLFIADLVLESSEDNEHDEQYISLSTIHSAKGLEWNCVLIMDLVEDRFPSRHAQSDAESFEEERRLMYVACTRAKQCLELYSPSNIYQKGRGSMPVSPSPFVRELPSGMCEEWYETYDGRKKKRQARNAAAMHFSDTSVPKSFSHHDDKEENSIISTTFQSKQTTQETQQDGNAPLPLGFCRHKIFGRGKMIKFIAPDKYQVNFTGFGIKTILKDFLLPEKE